MNIQRIIHKTKPGTSLLVGMGLTTIIVLVSLGVTTVVVSSIRESANVTGANQAYYAAEGALEKGLLVNQDKTAGFSDNAQVSTKQPKSNYSIGGQVSADPALHYDDGYGIPAPGTGDVGTDCDPLNPVVKNQFWYSADTKKFYYDSQSVAGVPNAVPYQPKEHPCNWSKINVGQSVTIPLYYTDGTGTHNIFTNQSQTFMLKIRPACKDGNIICTDADRFDLDTSKGDPNYKYTGPFGDAYDDPIISWQMSGESSDGSKTYVLSPYQSFKPSSNPPWLAGTTIIYKNILNNIPASGQLFQNQGGEDGSNCRGSIIKFLTGQGSGQSCSSTWVNQNITKPVFKFSVIHSLDAANNQKIPYLEYQIITSTSVAAPPTDVAQTVKAEGYSGSFKQVLEVKNPQETGLLEYVIQQ